jgi:diacylglycerol O-acyltransferase
MEKLGSLDAAFVYVESKAMPMHMAGMVIYDPSSAPGGKVTYEEILDNIAARAGSARALGRRLARVPLDLDHPYWVCDGPVDVRYHISRLALPEPADWRELCAQVARFLERPLDMSRPLWEMLVIEGLHGVDAVPPGAFALVTKMHHSAMDGISGMEFMGAIHDQEPSPALPSDTHTEQPIESPSPMNLLLRAVPGAVRNPWRILKLAPGLGPSLARRVLRNGAAVEAEPSHTTPKTRFNQPVGTARTVGGVRLALREIKKIKNAIPGATVNDVVMALVGGGLRHYLQDVEELPDESLIAGMAISLRSEQNSGGAGNQMTISTLPIGTDIADPLERVLTVHDAAAKRKAVRDGEAASRLVEIADAIPAGLMALAGRLMSQVEMSDKISLVNVGVTNVPGPSTRIYMTGAKATDIYGLGVVASGIGFINLVSSYCDSLTIGFQCSATMMPDPDRYEECLRRSYGELVEAAGSHPQKASPGTARRRVAATSRSRTPRQAQ